ncbi:MAG: PAS domain S-box protein [Chitinophagaceae bacterium]|nr:PAS domain S-box protein [Oligoflexus sp.]
MRISQRIFLPAFYAFSGSVLTYGTALLVSPSAAYAAPLLFALLVSILGGFWAGFTVALFTLALPHFFPFTLTINPTPGDAAFVCLATIIVSAVGHWLQTNRLELKRSKLKDVKSLSNFKAAEERFHSALAAAHAGIYRLDLRAGTAYRNASLNKIFGLQDKEAVFPINDFVMRIHLEDQQRVNGSIQRMIENKSSFSEQYRVYRADGSILWIKDRGVALLDEHGEVEAVTGTMVDITDLVQTEESLHRSQEQFRVLIESIKDYGIFLLDLKGNIISWNIGAERITGFTDTEAIGQHIRTIFSSMALSTNNTSEELEEARERGMWQGERWHARKNGAFFLAQEVVYPLLKNGLIYGYAKVVGDITLRKRAEESLQHSEARFRQLLEAMPQMVWSARVDYSFDYANQRWLDYTGMSKAEIAANGWSQLFAEGDAKATMAIWKEAAAASSAFSHEVRIRRGDGSYRWHLCRALPILDMDGNICEWFGTHTDIEEQKQLQSELMAAKQEAEEASQLKSAFLATVSHEIRTPLSAIIGFSRLLAEESWHEDKMKEFAQIALRNGYALARIIDDILDLSKVEAGKLEVARTEISVHDLLSEVMESLSVKAMEKSIGVNFHIEPDVPETIYSDATRIRQILINIIGNAIKFTIEGEVSVRVAIESQPKASLVIYVTDTGCGISSQNASFLFQPFVQADTSTSRKYGGTGLGLALSRKLSQLLGGNVTLVNSKPTGGSVFKIDLPLETFVAAEKCVRAAAKRIDVTSKPIVARLKGLKILVAEDAVDTQLLIRQILQKQGAELDFADNGKQAIECAESKDYDIILMDIQMPICDGYQATRTLRSRAYTKPIIGLSAHAMREEHEKIIASGCNEHLAKPFDPKKLVDLIETLSSSILAMAD